MTVLQKIIFAFISRKEGLVRMRNEHDAQQLDEAIGILKSMLPLEEQQIRDAFEAGEYYNSKKGYEEPAPDFKTYLTHLKTKA